MPLLQIGTHPKLVAKSTDTAPGRAIMALQNQTGRRLSELREEGAYSESLNIFVTGFLTLQTAGIFETWAELVERPVADFTFSETEKEIREREEREAEDKAEADPTRPPTDSPHEGSEPPESAAPKVPRKTTSSSSK